MTSFDAALAARPAYVPALAGRAEALIAGNRGVEAIAALEALIAADPQRTAARTRLETLRLQVIEGLVAEARAARQRNDLDAARTAWTRAVEASPDSADFLRELAQVERQAGQLDAALTHARAALLLDDGDAGTHALSASWRARAATCGRLSRPTRGRRRAIPARSTARASRISSAASTWPACPGRSAASASAAPSRAAISRRSSAPAWSRCSPGRAASRSRS